MKQYLFVVMFGKNEILFCGFTTDFMDICIELTSNKLLRNNTERMETVLKIMMIDSSLSFPELNL